MAKTKTEDKLLSIEERIKKLKEEKKRVERKMKLEIGKEVLSQWGIEDEKTAKELIIKLKPHAQQILSSQNSEGDDLKEHAGQQQQQQ